MKNVEKDYSKRYPILSLFSTTKHAGLKEMKFYLGFFIIFISMTSSIAQEKKKEYDFHGNLKSVYYLNQDGQKTGQEISYLWNGKKGTVKIWDNGKLKDSIIRYNDQGKVESIGYIEEDRLNFYKTNNRENKIEEITLKDGKENGLGILFKSNDEVYAFEHFQDGKKTGLIVLTEDYRLKGVAFEKGTPKHLLLYFYENGQIQSINTGGIRNDGVSLRFHDNGKLERWVRLNKGRKDEWQYSYDKKGVLSEKTLFEKGDVLKKVDLKGK